MDQSRGTLRTAFEMRRAYIVTLQKRGRDEFVEYICKEFGLDVYTAELFWDTIDTVVELGCTPAGENLK